MATKNFVDQVTVVDADWLNAIDAHVYDGNVDAHTSAEISYTPTGTGAVATTVQDKLRESVSVKDFGAVGDGVTDDTAAIQAGLDYVAGPGGTLFFPTGTYLISSTLTWGNGTKLIGVGSDSLIKGASMTTSMLQSKGTSLSRRYRLHVADMGFDNTSSAAAGAIGVDLRNATDCKITNVFFSNIATGVEHYADSGLGCYYNTLHDCVFTSCTNGIVYAQLANENRNYSCRTNSVTYPITVSDGSHNHIISPSLEIFTTGIRISGPAYDTQIFSPRLENLPTSGTGISITGAAVRTAIINPQYTSLTTNLNLAMGQGTTVNGRERVTAVLDFPSIAAGTVSDLAVTISGALPTDSVQVTPPSTLASGLVCMAIPSSGQHYVRMGNISSGPIDPASATFTLDVRRSE